MHDLYLTKNKSHQQYAMQRFSIEMREKKFSDSYKKCCYKQTAKITNYSSAKTQLHTFPPSHDQKKKIKATLIENAHIPNN